MEPRTTPKMAPCEVEIMDSLFESVRPARVLEWGSGGSTIYWPPRHECIEDWLAIEHQRNYYDHVRGHTSSKVTTVLTEPGEPYVYAPHGMFNLILVDGANRLACMARAARILAPYGVVVLHDAGRWKYRRGWLHFPYHELLYPGDKPCLDDGYLHNGLAVFWMEADLDRRDWCRDYLVQ